MIQTSAMPRADRDEAGMAPPSVWGLSARELHDGFWHGRGVECVRRGQRAPLQRAAELYLLIEPGQLVLFDLAELSERLVWYGALATRLRLVDAEAEHYSERVVLDDRGLVERIERRYVPAGRETYRVILTTRRRLAGLWMAAGDRREGWRGIRKAVSSSRMDHARLAGSMYPEGDPSQERRLLSQLVELWRQPDQAIDGIEASEPGVWHRAGRRLPPGVTRVGPLWLGDDGDAEDARRCLIGPDWVGDDPSRAEDAPVIVREISEVTMPTVGRPRSAGSERRVYPAIKRLLDIGASGVALLVAAPTMLVIAILIRLEDGWPVLFGHTRQGRGGQAFTCWKFRTMYRNAERIARQLEAYNVCDGPQVFIQDDPRVTRIGRLLRATHLDELPQLWNVLRGDMSLVGPRPSPDDENVYCPAWRDSRLSVRPGITGLWQLERTREPGNDFQEWIRYDIEYVRRASLWLDLVILVKTARILILGRPDRAAE